MAIFGETDLGTKSKDAVTELSSGKYVAVSLGLVTLRLGLGLGLGIITDLSSGTYIDACSDLVPELSLGLGLGLWARIRVRVRSETCWGIAESTIRVQSPSFLRGNTTLRVWGSSSN